MVTLFDPFALGALALPNRIAMAPMTRMRAGPGNTPTALTATYYAQRASAGLLIAEGSHISSQARGYLYQLGIDTPAQIAGWRRVTSAVHEAGGRIYQQIQHCGRASHPEFQPDGGAPVAPSAIGIAGEALTSAGPVRFVAPRALDLAELPGIVEQFRRAAGNAQAAGFDGVEIHGANGYLLDQFLQDSSNHRTDRYGGSLANRARLMIEVAEAVASVWGAGRVGIRLSPINTHYDMRDSDPAATFAYAVAALDRLGLLYLHLREMPAEGDRLGARHFRPMWRGALIVNGGYDRVRADAALAAGSADLVAFGQLFVANPDLPRRFRAGAPLNKVDPATLAEGGAEGYVDYPSLDTKS